MQYKPVESSLTVWLIPFYFALRIMSVQTSGGEGLLKQTERRNHVRPLPVMCVCSHVQECECMQAMDVCLSMVVVCVSFSVTVFVLHLMLLTCNHFHPFEKANP